MTEASDWKTGIAYEVECAATTVCIRRAVSASDALAQARALGVLAAPVVAVRPRPEFPDE